MNFSPAPRSESSEGERVWQFKHREKAKGKPASKQGQPGSEPGKWSGWFDCSFAQAVESKRLNADIYHDFEYECREIWIPKKQVLEHSEENKAILKSVSAYYESEQFKNEAEQFRIKMQNQELGWLGRVVFPWLHRWTGTLPSK